MLTVAADEGTPEKSREVQCDIRILLIQTPPFAANIVSDSIRRVTPCD